MYKYNVEVDVVCIFLWNVLWCESTMCVFLNTNTQYKIHSCCVKTATHLIPRNTKVGLAIIYKYWYRGLRYTKVTTQLRTQKRLSTNMNLVGAPAAELIAARWEWTCRVVTSVGYKLVWLKWITLEQDLEHSKEVGVVAHHHCAHENPELVDHPLELHRVIGYDEQERDYWLSDCGRSNHQRHVHNYH